MVSGSPRSFHPQSRGLRGERDVSAFRRSRERRPLVVTIDAVRARRDGVEPRHSVRLIRSAEVRPRPLARRRERIAPAPGQPVASEQRKRAVRQRAEPERGVDVLCERHDGAAGIDDEQRRDIDEPPDRARRDETVAAGGDLIRGDGVDAYRRDRYF